MGYTSRVSCLRFRQMPACARVFLAITLACSWAKPMAGIRLAIAFAESQASQQAPARAHAASSCACWSHQSRPEPATNVRLLSAAGIGPASAHSHAPAGKEAALARLVRHRSRPDKGSISGRPRTGQGAAAVRYCTGTCGPCCSRIPEQQGMVRYTRPILQPMPATNCLGRAE
jgi:hypothetical protein